MNTLLLKTRRLCAAALAAFMLIGALPQPAQAQGAEPNLGPDVQASDPMQIQPAGPEPEWAPTIDPQMLAVIEQFLASEPPTPLTQLSAFQLRNAVLPAGAVLELLAKTGPPAQQPQTDVAHRVLDVGPEDGLLVRTYTPLDAGEEPLPVIVYYHGGGWVIADLDTYEASAEALAAKTGAVVVSVAYRQAPEHEYPTAHEDAFAAYQWVTENADSLGGDPERIATAGESAGGNLAVAVALMAEERGAPMPAHVLAVYPVADGDVQSESYDEYANAVPLNRPLMEWFFDRYTPRWQQNERPLIALVDAEYTGDFPSTTIINAEIDPLRAEGEALAQRLEEAGVDVEQQTFGGVTHEFFGMAALLEQAAEAQDLAARRLQSAFGSGAMSDTGMADTTAAMQMTRDGEMEMADDEETEMPPDTATAPPDTSMMESEMADPDTSMDADATTMASDAASVGAATPSDTTMQGAGGSARLMTAEDAELGTYLTDAEGRALYLFKADSAGTSACYDACAEAWPPLFTQGEPQAGSGVEANMLGTLEREDGQMQVTYGGHPLYYFARDAGPGQTQGQDVMGFGAEWYLVSPGGEEVHGEEMEEDGER